MPGAPFVARNWNHPQVRRGFGIAEPRTESGVREFLENQAGEDDELRLLVCDEGPVGIVFLNRIDDHHGRANLGYWVDPAHQRQGYATEAARLVVEYAFAERRLNKVNVRALAENTASRSVIESLGFEQEGVAREAYYVDGECRDMVSYGLLREAWERNRGRA